LRENVDPPQKLRDRRKMSKLCGNCATQDSNFLVGIIKGVNKLTYTLGHYNNFSCRLLCANL